MPMCTLDINILSNFKMCKYLILLNKLAAVFSVLPFFITTFKLAFKFFAVDCGRLKQKQQQILTHYVCFVPFLPYKPTYF